MWVDEGDGQIPAQLAKAAAGARQCAAAARATPGRGRPLPTAATPPGPASPRTGRDHAGRLAGVGERPRRPARRRADPDASTAAVVVEGPEDLFRPTAAVTADGTPWLLFGRSRRRPGRGLGEPVHRRPLERPGAGQRHRRAVLQPGGRRAPRRQPARVLAGPGRGPVRRVRPPLRTPARGRAGSGRRRRATTSGTRPWPWSPRGMAYAWAEYAEGSYRVALRRVDGDGPGPIRLLTAGTDYALHPSLATTTDGRLWCAFDVITVQGHGGSGPPGCGPGPAGVRSEEPHGMREPGASVPPELLPEVSAGIRVVRRRRRRAGRAARRAGPRAERGALGAAPAAGHRRRRARRRLPDPPPAAADDLLLGGRGPGARAGRLAAPDHVRRHRRHAGGGLAGRRPRPGCCWPPRPTGGWTAP